MKPYILSQSHYKTVKEASYKVAILPWGATEAHNYHLPYGTDNIQAQWIAEQSAEMAWNKGAKVVVLPTVPFGVNTTQLDIPMTINMNPTTQMKVLEDIIVSLQGQGIHKLVILNAHGGNDFKFIIRELQPKFPDFLIFQLNWFITVPWEKYFEDMGDHAGEQETSVMLHIAPKLVLPIEQAGDGAAKSLIFKGRSEGWLWAPRKWTKVSKDTGIGNPAKATAALGKKYVDEALVKIADFYLQLCEANTDDIYE